METLLKDPIMKTRDLAKYGLKDSKAHWNLSPEELQAITIEKGMGRETANGTLAVNTDNYFFLLNRFIIKSKYFFHSSMLK